jgi:hypothetical protein
VVISARILIRRERDLNALPGWAAQFLTDTAPDVPRKLAANGYPERQAFIWATVTTPYEIASILDGDALPRRHPTFPTALPICGFAADTPVRARSIGGQTTAGPRLTASHPTAASSCRIASKRSGARAVGGSSEAWGPHRPPPGLVAHPRIRRDDRHRSRPQLIQRAVTTSTVPPAEQRQPAHALRNSAGSPPATTPQAARPAQS